jgi:nitroreductase
MEFSDVIKKRRSCRAFKDVPVTDEQLQTIVDAGQWAPSPLNMQPFQFVAVKDKTIKAQIQKAGIEAKQIVIDNSGPDWVAKYPMNFVGDAPLIIVVVFDPNKGGLGNYFGQPHGAMQATCACIQNMMLQAAELSLDSLWFTFFEPSTLGTILDIPDHLDIAGAILVGHPASETRAPKRKNPKVHIDKFKAE